MRSISNEELYQELVRWRARVAEQNGLILPRIAFNETLRSIAERRPQELKEIRRIKGIGPCKAAAYGTDILEIVNGAAGESKPIVDYRNWKMWVTANEYVLDSAAIQTIIDQKPKTLEEVENIPGVNIEKLRKYGQAFINKLPW